MTRVSTVSFSLRSPGLSRLTSKHCSSSKSWAATESLQGCGPATATPVMVMTTTSGVGWATSMLPPPASLKPWRTGVTWPWPAVRVMTGGGGGGGGGGSGLSAARAHRSRAGRNPFILTFLLERPRSLRSVAEDDVERGGEDAVLALEGPRLVVVI